MRRVIVSTFVTLDGVVEAPETWSFDFHDEQNMKDALALVLDAEALLLGRTTYESFAEAWPSRTDPMGFADKMNAMPKYVASTTLREPTWAGTEVLDGSHGDVADQVAALKADGDGDLLMYGSATLMRHLLAAGQIDEIRLLLNPVVVGSGRTLFPEGQARTTLDLVETHQYPGGMARLTLRARR
ncbi:dihydrofolate reductase family protein [Cryptosporangium japonicum]|uniref:Dihydrofolate reductase family protein n=1 Tax=Cryptosporangium japonicum TaxID=80872 RepID=A0ABP3DBM8_9ACTN